MSLVDGCVVDVDMVQPLFGEHISDDDHFKLFSTFINLNFLKGICSCLLSIEKNPRNVKGLVSLKYKELLDTLFTSREHFIETVTSPDRKNEGIVRGNILANCFDSQNILKAYDCILETSAKASQVEIALAICHADSTEYKRGLLEQLGTDIPIEIIPAILKSLLISLEMKEELMDMQNEPIYNAVVKLRDCLFSGGLEELSTRGFSALITLFDYGLLKKRELVQEAVKELENRIENLDRYKDVLEGKLLAKSAMLLLKSSEFVLQRLSRCLCKHAHFITPGQIPIVLDIFVKLGFNEKEWLRMLEPYVEVGLFDPQTMLKVEKLCNTLGILTKPPIEESHDENGKL
ncbi:hypothetical protein BEWA_035470 [Theileria equi strain WA]|uniref:Uncharacterized protein n=1 Tax=Theileria equi strain WA TaxID=1537102 RepID=L1LDS8_THEEQ|nr:hypothetical protein BEWA_035470 [Theileria equi strain WA]EKX73511.1 hypothetical protein BEWA_035470 [Theileria equi strain WA]|eukprot:XP_004832963.1 hypothetical protein BEWA_035470 [Theileria equi strain WA]